ncbi:BMC domain-containing protein [Desulfosporosinus orientis DSM 765]|uniref:BMC domain-containing protein n=1 Tax=Desulfosporosinus orientis (strain ATCC 19365 / DSM 765 / NCIMB 8382 / VKM B-1628 / Singapore I) TaxID=768706 RepID=G7WEH8_DESOD|nr:BMC domain-containing protein [Desulfosporosinus orientis]AET70791.1 BMC domain-containing protein [Desulfosporosinus orientis DSM 765]
MEYRIIKSPSRGTLDILFRRKGSPSSVTIEDYDAVGLVQGRLIDMVFAADIAEKGAGVVVEDIKGHCPQNLIMIAIFGDTASVEAAIKEIQYKLKEAKTGEIG